MNKRTTPTGFRLTEKGRGLLQALAEKLGVNQTAVVEMALRQMAEREKVEAKEVSEQA